MRWMTDWDEAARHPWKATSTTFVFIWVVVAAYGYARWGLSLLLSAVVGCGFGLLVVMLLLAVIGQARGWPTWVSGVKGQMPRVGFGIAYLWGGAGAAIVVWGVATGSVKLALVGLPLIALGLFWHLIRRSVGR